MDIETIAYIIIPVIAIICGFIIGVLNILSNIGIIVAGLFFSATYWETVSKYIGEYFDLSPTVCIILAVVIILIATTIAFNIVLSILKKLVDLTHLNIVDRILGALVAGGIAGTAMQMLMPYLKDVIG